MREPAVHGPTLFNHPTGLTVLALANMWEAFALFGMRTVLVYYLVKQLGFAEASAIEIYSYSVGGAFFLGVVGGLTVDRVIKPVPAILLGTVLMAAGSYLLVVPDLLFLGLGLSGLGYGLFRPTVSAEVGNLYALDDPRLERGYAIFLVLSNVGGMLAPLVCGTIGELFGWNWSFVASGSGMVVAGLIVFFGRNTLRPTSGRRASSVGHAPAGTDFQPALPVLAAVWIAAACIWAGYNQIGGAVALWADSGIDRTIALGGNVVTIPAAWFQSLNPIFFVVLAPFVMRWLARRSGKSGIRSDLTLIATGAILIGAFFAIIAFAAGSQDSRPSWIWLALAIIPYTLGELLFSPAGHALFSRAAPIRFSALVMSFWFLTIMAGFASAGFLGRFWNQVEPAVYLASVALLPLAGAAIAYASRVTFARPGGKR